MNQFNSTTDLEITIPTMFTEDVVAHKDLEISQDTIKQKKKSLCSVHRRWIRQTLITTPEEWHISQLASAFEQKFPSLGKKYLTQTHIDNQRRKVRDTITIKLNEIQDNDITSSMDHETNNVTTSHPTTATKETTNVSNLLNIDQTIYNASNMLANQAVYFVDLLDERGLRTNHDISNDHVTTIPIQGLILPMECTDTDMHAIQTQIDAKTQELVELLVTKRGYQANKVTSHDKNTKSIFVGYVANHRPNNRSYHFIAGGSNADIDPTAVKVLSALYATQPLLGNKKKNKVIIKTKRDCLFRATRIKPLNSNESTDIVTKASSSSSSAVSSS